ncbi:MAG: hypothetical protein KA126_05270 [Candidatus Hydrothermae bacterium]|nr:hypothetical protein [Candidatus Hydrothermae bacterium]
MQLSIYNVNGQLVKRLVAGGQPAGSYNVRWGGCDE